MSRPDDHECYSALCARDASYEGLFFACVRTTGIFCRPTCRARKPLRGNVEFVESAAEALRAGFRPCKVCRPLAPAGEQPAWAQALIDQVAAAPQVRVTDAELRARDLEPATVRRHFKRRFGLTFHAWQRAWRLGGAMRALRAGEAIDDLPAAGGYESPGAFREAFTRLFGAPPSRVEPGDALVADWIESPLGPLLAVAAEDGLALLEFVDRRAIEAQVATLRKRFGRPVGLGPSPHLDRIRVELDEYFRGQRRRFDVPLALAGTDFEVEVWRALIRIPYGTTKSYAALADQLGRAGAARAVGRANGCNRLAIVVPCHRVVGADGKLTGYGGGLGRKRWLLDLERSGPPAGAPPRTREAQQEFLANPCCAPRRP